MIANLESNLGALKTLGPKVKCLFAPSLCFHANYWGQYRLGKICAHVPLITILISVAMSIPALSCQGHSKALRSGNHRSGGLTGLICMAKFQFLQRICKSGEPWSPFPSSLPLLVHYQKSEEILLGKFAALQLQKQLVSKLHSTMHAVRSLISFTYICLIDNV